MIECKAYRKTVLSKISKTSYRKLEIPLNLTNKSYALRLLNQTDDKLVKSDQF